MERIALPGGRWFARDKARHFEEAQYFDGRNFISKATGDQWEHEELYRTPAGTWVKRAWSQWQGSRPDWDVIPDDEAALWLITNSHGAELEALGLQVLADESEA